MASEDAIYGTTKYHLEQLNAINHRPPKKPDASEVKIDEEQASRIAREAFLYACCLHCMMAPDTKCPELVADFETWWKSSGPQFLHRDPGIGPDDIEEEEENGEDEEDDDPEFAWEEKYKEMHETGDKQDAAGSEEDEEDEEDEEGGEDNLDIARDHANSSSEEESVAKPSSSELAKAVLHNLQDRVRVEGEMRDAAAGIVKGKNEEKKNAENENEEKLSLAACPQAPSQGTKETGKESSSGAGASKPNELSLAAGPQAPSQGTKDAGKKSSSGVGASKPKPREFKRTAIEMLHDVVWKLVPGAFHADAETCAKRLTELGKLTAEFMKATTVAGPFLREAQVYSDAVHELNDMNWIRHQLSKTQELYLEDGARKAGKQTSRETPGALHGAFKVCAAFAKARMSDHATLIHIHKYVCILFHIVSYCFKHV